MTQEQRIKATRQAVIKLNERQQGRIKINLIVPSSNDIDLHIIWEKSGYNQAFCFPITWFTRDWWGNDRLDDLKKWIGDYKEYTDEELAIIKIGCYLWKYGHEVGRY